MMRITINNAIGSISGLLDIGSLTIDDLGAIGSAPFLPYSAGERCFLQIITDAAADGPFFIDVRPENPNQRPKP